MYKQIFKYLNILNIINVIEVMGVVSITLSVPEELKEEMDKHPEMNWSEIARQAIKERIVLLKKMDAFLVNSKMTEKDAIELGRKVNKALAKRYAR